MRYLTLPILLAGLVIGHAQSGNRVRVISGTDTISDWNLQKEATWSLTGNSTNTHSNVPTGSSFKTAYLIRVSSDGTNNVKFAFPGGITTNWVSQYVEVPRNGQTEFLFTQIGSTVDISAYPDVFTSTDGFLFGRLGGTNTYASPSAFGVTGSFAAYNTTGTHGITNSVTETTAFTATIPANTLGTNHVLNFGVSANLLSTTAAYTVTVRVKYGGSTILSGATLSIAANGSPRYITVLGELAAAQSASAQRSGMRVIVSAPGTSGTEYGQVNTVNAVDASRGATSSIDSTVNQTFEITLALSVATATISWTTEDGWIKE